MQVIKPTILQHVSSSLTQGESYYQAYETNELMPKSVVSTPKAALQYFCTLFTREENIMKKTKTVLGIIALALGLCIITGTQSFAADYPTKPIQLIVPWSPGGDSDSLMRVIAHYAGKYLGQPVVVVNMPGVGGNLGSRKGKDAKPDGYTLTATHESVITSKIVGITDYGFDDFTLLANMVNTPSMVVTRGDAPWNNMSDLIKDAKKRPGQITFGATLGSTSHFFPLYIAHVAGIKFKIVGYEGTAKRQSALLGGFLDLGESNPSAGLKYFEAKKLKPLGVADTKRHPMLPNVATLAEQGIDITFGVHRGVCAPKGTPKAIVDKLSEAFGKEAKDPEFIAKVKSLGSTVEYQDRAAFAAYVKSERTTLEDLAKSFNIHK